MATLKEPVQIFIVQSLACFETAQQVADAVKQEFAIEISVVCSQPCRQLRNSINSTSE